VCGADRHALATAPPHHAHADMNLARAIDCAANDPLTIASIIAVRHTAQHVRYHARSVMCPANFQKSPA